MTFRATHSKALAGFVAAFVGVGGALVALGFLTGPVSHDLAVALIASTPALVFVGVLVAPANATTEVAPVLTAARTFTDAPAPLPVTRGERLAAELLELRTDWEQVTAALNGPLPPAVDRSTVLGGVVEGPIPS